VRDINPGSDWKVVAYTFGTVLMVALAFVLMACGSGEPAQQEASAGRVTLIVTSMSPLAVSGRGFESGERVAVSTGARFVGLGCAGATIVAVGSKGSRATTRPPKVLCVEP
jgi:hypothetical protein